MPRKQLCATAAVILSLMLANVEASGQTATTSVFTSGLRAPIKAIFSAKGNLLVSEAGSGPNTGRISIVESSGNRRTLVDGLPSGLAPPNSDPSGPSGLAQRGRTFYVAIGAGDETLRGPVPGTEIPNPNPSSAFFSSVLSLKLSPLAEDTTQGFTMSAADQLALQNRGFARLDDGAGNQLTVEVLINFRSFTFEPIPPFAGNARASNIFGLAINGKKLYVVDASQNQVWEVDSNTGDARVVFKFGSIPNPTPVGPPFIDLVPDSVRVVGKSLLIPYLTGFPFPQGAAGVRKIRLVNGANEPFISGLTSALDVLPVEGPNDQFQFFTLEFSTNQLMGAPGRLQRFDGTGASSTVLVSNLVTPTSLSRDPVSGDLFVTEISTGRVIKVHLP
jgi:hypothetical protein